MATVIQSIAPESESCSPGYIPDAQRVELIRQAACEIANLAELMADRAGVDFDGEQRVPPNVVRTLNQRVYVLGLSVLRCLDELDDAERIKGKTFPETCRCVMGSGDDE